MSTDIPSTIRGQKYISLTTFRKNGGKVATPVWFGEDDDKLYVMTRSDMGKTKRIRNSPQVTVAACTIRGKVTGPEVAALARILPPEEHAHARQAINRKILDGSTDGAVEQGRYLSGIDFRIASLGRNRS
jgi:uncharacterized protein